MVIAILELTPFRILSEHSRVEKYRPDTLDDVSGHQDILATINRFVDTNVVSTTMSNCAKADETTAITTSSPLWPARHRENIYNTSPRSANIWE